MITFKHTNTIAGKIKDIVATSSGTFVDNETGEQIDLAGILYQQYGDSPFDLAASLKTEIEK